MRSRYPPAPPAPPTATVYPTTLPRHFAKRLAILTAIVILAIMYVSGTFDHALVNVGLNFKPCARNGFGATFCGSELTEYQRHMKGLTEGR